VRELPYSHTQLDTTGNYSVTAILYILLFTVAHALEFSVFISRILATDFLPSECNFTSHMKFSFHGLIPFLPLFCNCQFRRLYSLLSTTILYSSSKTKPKSDSFSNYGLPPICSFWSTALWYSREEAFFQLIFCGNSPYITFSLTKRWAYSYEYACRFVKCTFRTYSMLSKILCFTVRAGSLSA
jgi:hypothetical protein